MNPEYKYLIEKYSKKYDYIGIGGLIDRRLKRKFKIEFLNYVFKICKGVKLHGLGLHADMYLKKFPFYSVDFSTWLNTRRYGCSVIPGYSKEDLLIRNKEVKSDDRLDEEIQYIKNRENRSYFLFMSGRNKVKILGRYLKKK